RVTIQLLDGDVHSLKVASFVNDLSVLPAGISLIANGYISPETALSLGLPATQNRLSVRFRDASGRDDIERKLTTLTAQLENGGTTVLSASVPQPDQYILGDNMTSVLFILQS